MAISSLQSGCCNMFFIWFGTCLRFCLSCVSTTPNSNNVNSPQTKFKSLISRRRMKLRWISSVNLTGMTLSTLPSWSSTTLNTTPLHPVSIQISTMRIHSRSTVGSMSSTTTTMTPIRSHVWVKTASPKFNTTTPIKSIVCFWVWWKADAVLNLAHQSGQKSALMPTTLTRLKWTLTCFQNLC